ncbi:hypothetical protein CSQ79_14985 [Gloeocapsopsis sp. IPPAS B-1203]|nr:hypothetical protein CSQ79_14985 [Gloeocapsopsis sp. IPPAS B-1203]
MTQGKTLLSGTLLLVIALQILAASSLYCFTASYLSLLILKLTEKPSCDHLRVFQLHGEVVQSGFNCQVAIKSIQLYL